MVLAYLRMHSESTDFVLQEYELDGIVRQAVHKYAPMFIRKRIRLELEPISSRVLTDEKWLCFVIEQLLSNALKYTDAGSVHIYTEGTDTLVIQDTGSASLRKICRAFGKRASPDITGGWSNARPAWDFIW